MKYLWVFLVKRGLVNSWNFTGALQKVLFFFFKLNKQEKRFFFFSVLLKGVFPHRSRSLSDHSTFCSACVGDLLYKCVSHSLLALRGLLPPGRRWAHSGHTHPPCTQGVDQHRSAALIYRTWGWKQNCRLRKMKNCTHRNGHNKSY